MQAHPILHALEEQVGCYRRLAKLAALQHDHVQQGRTEALLEVLSLRQQELNQIGLIERRLSSARQRWSECLDELAPEQRGIAEGFIAESRQLLEEITAADRNDALVLQQRKLNLGREIQQATAARGVNRRYATAAYGPRVSRMDVQR